MFYIFHLFYLVLYEDWNVIIRSGSNNVSKFYKCTYFILIF